jgi:hypothetical protein
VSWPTKIPIITKNPPAILVIPKLVNRITNPSVKIKAARINPR